MKCVRLETFVLYFGICCIIIFSILTALFFGLFIYSICYAIAGPCYNIWSIILWFILFEIFTILLCLSIVLVIGIRKKKLALLKWYYLLGSILNIVCATAIVFYILWSKSEAFTIVYIILSMNALYCVVLILVGRLYMKYRHSIPEAIKFCPAGNQYLFSNENPVNA